MKADNRIGMRLVPGAIGILALTGSNTADGSPGTPDAVNPVPSEQGAQETGSSIITRTSVLWSSPQWQALRMVWRKMDSFTPEDGDYTEHHLEPEEAAKIRIELQEAFSGIRPVMEELGLTELDIELLNRLAYSRLDMLSYGSSMPMTRMMPPPVSDQTSALIPVIEARIDSLRVLRERGVLTGPEVEAVFGDLRENIELYFILETIHRSTSYTGYLWYQEWPMEESELDDYIDSLRTAMPSDPFLSPDSDSDYVREMLEEEIGNLKTAISETRARFPVLRDMLISLELI